MSFVLRPVELADLPVLFEHQRDPVSVAMADFPARDRAAFDLHWARILRDPSGIIRVLDAGGAVVGNVLSWDASAGREVGYWIAREHWGKGLASAALGQFLELERVRPLHANVVPHNTASLRVLAKHGFQVVATAEDGVDLLLQ